MSATQDSPSTVAAPHPGRYWIDPDRSTIALRTTHMLGLGAVRATLAVQGGQIIVAELFGSSRVVAHAGAASFDSGNPGRDKRVRSKALLDAEHHPDIGFVSSSVSAADGTWVVRGTLTAHGVAAPCELTVTETVDRPDGLTIVATGTVDRYAHRVGGRSGLISRQVELTITAVARLTD
jgi:polyisoprenoid-binding protein YceI